MEQKKKSNFGIGLLLGLILGLIVVSITVSIFVIIFKTQKVNIGSASKNNQTAERKEDIENNETEEDNYEDSQKYKEYSDGAVKAALQYYLNLVGALNSSPSNVLYNLCGEDSVTIDQDNHSIDHYLKTNIKYEEFESRILNYMSKEEFARFNVLGFSEGNFKNIDGMVYVADTGASGDHWEVETIEKLENNKYIGHTIWMFEDLEETKKDVDFEFTIKDDNNRCVIDSCDNGTNVN